MIDDNGVIKKSNTQSSLVHNYESRVQQMMRQQNASWGRREPHGLRPLAGPWAEVLQTNVLLISDRWSNLTLFGPDPIKLLDHKNSAPRHLMHGWMVMRPYVFGAAERAPIHLTTAAWHRLLDHRGWANVWGDISDRDKTKREETVALQQVFLPQFQAAGVKPPRSWCDATYNGRTYTWTATSEPIRGRTTAQKAGKLHRVTQEIPARDWDELLWEITEFNHRSEVRALDQEMINPPRPRDAAVAKVFFSDKLTTDKPPMCRVKNQEGLAGRDVKSRRSHVLALLTLMSTWYKPTGERFFDDQLQSYLDQIWDGDFNAPLKGFDPISVQEINVVKAFARAFVLNFKRAPIAPRLALQFEETSGTAGTGAASGSDGPSVTAGSSSSSMEIK